VRKKSGKKVYFARLEGIAPGKIKVVVSFWVKVVHQINAFGVEGMYKLV